MDINHYKRIYFLGIGGIGMSALARYFFVRGVVVCGYDKTPSVITHALEQEGISVHYDEDIKKIPADTQLVIYTPAIPSDNKLFLHIAATGLPCIKRAEALGLISSAYHTIAIAGTHGKTTISCMLAHILHTAGIKAEALLGGISSNYKTNYLRGTDTSLMVVEADEYDRSFLYLTPDMAVITAIDADHLDIYGDRSKLQDSFVAFTRRIKDKGVLLIKKGLLETAAIVPEKLTYGLHPGADYSVESYAVRGQRYVASFAGRLPLSDVDLGLPGRHNIENALAAAAIAQMLGAGEQAIREALSGFTGVYRRFEICFSSENTTYVDDYAHHPEELNACIDTAREMFPGKKITGVFQPHLFSRTRDLADGFAQSLQKLDTLLMLDIYPAREKPIEGISAEWLLEKVHIQHKKLVQKEELLTMVAAESIEVLLTMGAGDIDRLVQPIKERLIQRQVR